MVLVAESAECWLLRAAGDKGERTERQAAASKTWQPKDRDGAGVKPRSREAVRHLAQGFTRDDSPGGKEWWRRIL